MTRPRPRPRRRRFGPLVAAVAGGLVLFALGIAVGQALNDNPPTGQTQTRVRTLTPMPLPPAGRTVTVTTTRP